MTKRDLQSKGHVDEGFIGLFLVHNLSNSESVAHFYIGVNGSIMIAHDGIMILYFDGPSRRFYHFCF